MYQNYLNINTKQIQVLTDLRKNPSSKKYKIFRKFVQSISTKKKTNKNLSLLSLLILPIQRLPRYQLLLKEICEHTNATHADFLGLESAYKMIESVNVENNEHISDFQQRQRVIEICEEIEGYQKTGCSLISPSRKFVYKQLMFKLGDKRNLYIFYLFSDCIIYAHYNGTYIEEECNEIEHKSDVTAKKKKKNKFLMYIPIDSAFFIEDADGMFNIYCFSVICTFFAIKTQIPTYAETHLAFTQQWNHSW